MKPIRADHAKVINQQLMANGTIIIAFDESGAIQGASYGRNQKECNAMGKLLDAFVDQLEGENFYNQFANNK